MMEQKQRKQRMMLIGRSAAGKTTLCQRINKEDLRYHKTQTVSIINKNIIDTPGEYLERFSMRGALIVTSTEADVIVLVQDATESGTMFPPYFNSMFTKPVVGVVTKCDIATQEQMERAEKFLRAAGTNEIYFTSSVTGEGVDQLVERLQIL